MPAKGKKPARPAQPHFEVLPTIRPIAQLLRIWPDEKSSLVVLIILFSATTIPNLWFIFKYQNEDILELIFAIAEFCSFFIHNVKLLYCYSQREKLMNLIVSLEGNLQLAFQVNMEPWIVARQKMQKFLRLMEKLYKLAYSILGLAATLPLVASCFRMYVLRHNNSIEQCLKLNYFGYFTSKNSINLGHVLGTTVQFIHIYIILFMGILAPFLIYCLAEYFHFVELRFNEWNICLLEQDYKEKVINEDENLKKLVEVIEEHCTAISLYKELYTFFNPILVLDVFPAIFLLCTISFFITEFTNSIALQIIFLASILTVIFTVFFLSYLSNYLMTLNSSIAETVWNFDWYNQPPSMRRIFILIMRNAQRERYISAGYFFHVSLEGFTTIMSTSFSYFTIMRNIYSVTEKTG